MRFGLYQFAVTQDIEHNLERIGKAITAAANAGVHIIAFPECALCGYPPIESNIEQINQSAIENALSRISFYARENNIYVIVGTVRFENNQRFNSVILCDTAGIQVGHYDKTALWGWDADNFARGTGLGIFEIDDMKIGLRICFDVRFPESFRELYRNRVNIAIVCFSDTSETDDELRYGIIRSHLLTRAVENVMTILSVNSISRFQTALTAVFNQNGSIVSEATNNHEELLIFDYTIPEITFGMQGRIVNADYFLHLPSQLPES